MKRAPRDPARSRVSIAPGVEVSPICLGMVSEARTVARAFREGINFFFVSTDLHWPGYEALRRGLSTLLQRVDRSEIVVCATSYASAPDFVKASVGELLADVRELRYVDVLCAGGLDDVDFERRIDGVARLRADGLCRNIAASFHARPAAAKAIRASSVDLAFVRFNPLHTGARDDLFPLIRKRKIPVFNFKSTTGHFPRHLFRALELPRGTWHPPVTDYYRFAWGEPGLDGILASPATPRELDAMLAALRSGPLESDEREHLVALAYRAAEKRIRLFDFRVPGPPPLTAQRARSRKPAS